MRRWLFVAVLAGCGSDGPSYAPPPPEAVASCVLVATNPYVDHARNELWFDSAGRMIQADGFLGSSRYAYDDQNRLVMADNASDGTVTFTYEASRITVVTTHGSTSYSELYQLDASGRATHVDGPNESVDFMHDDAGRLTAITGMSLDDTYTYDPEGRLASSDTHQPMTGPTTFTYDEGPAGVYIHATGGWQREYTYDLDGAGRVIRSTVDGFGYTYSYDGDRVTAKSDDMAYEVDSTGACPGLTTRLQPFDPVPFRVQPNAVKLPNPPVEDFGYSH